MINLGDGHKLSKDRHQWILHTAVEGKDKDGNPKTHWRESYHATLAQAARHITDSACEAAATADDLMSAVDEAATRIEAALLHIKGGNND